MINPFLLAVIIMWVIVFVIFNVYLYAYYAHSNDTWFGQSLGMKVTIVRRESGLSF
jgi:uncharacterized RDD family membrane protein YckC